MRVRAVALIAMVLVVAACGDAGDGPPIAFPGSVTTMDDGREIAVVGFLQQDGPVRVCEALAESYPPQCGGSSVIVTNLYLPDLDGVSSAGEVWWTDFAVELVGHTTAGTLRYLRHQRL